MAAVAVLLASVVVAQPALAVRPGDDVLHVPMAWCVLNGSPAQANPNIVNEGTGVADTDTDAIIWRRHERPTDNIFLPQATLSLRSAINNAWGTFNFPTLADPDTANGQPGDVNGWDVNNDGTEFTTLINNCDTEYTNQGRAGIGITTVNVGLFHDNANPANDGNAQFDYVGVIGWGGCTEPAPGTCGTPFDGQVMVIDNNYRYPTVADRTFPPSPADPTGSLQFVITDPLDQLVGHEVGHALSLDHRNVSTALMFGTSTDNDADGRVDNIALNASEVTALRANANNVPGLEVDPPGVFKPGRHLAMRIVDGRRTEARRGYQDIAAMTADLDRRRGRVHLAQRLWGLLPAKRARTTAYWTAADLDSSRRTGADEEDLARLRAPAELEGADVIARAQVVGRRTINRRVHTWQARARAWTIDDGELSALPRSAFDVDVLTLRMHPHFANISDQRRLPRDFVAEVYNTIAVEFRNAALPMRVRTGRAFGVHGLVTGGRKALDRLGKDRRGERFILEPPSFPHCFPAGEATPGGTVEVTFDGLRPGREIHALLGPDEVVRGPRADEEGAGRIDLPIPREARAGDHLVTIGHDGIALTADCTVTVRG